MGLRLLRLLLLLLLMRLLLLLLLLLLMRVVESSRAVESHVIEVCASGFQFSHRNLISDLAISVRGMG